MRQKIDLVRKELEKTNVNVSSQEGHCSFLHEEEEDMRQRIERVRADLKDLTTFYNISISSLRTARLKNFYESELTALKKTDFQSFDQQAKVDYLLLQNFLKKGLQQLELDVEKDKKAVSVLPFAPTIVRLCKERQQVKPMDTEKAARDVHEISKQIDISKKEVFLGKINMEKTVAFRAANTVESLYCHLEEWFKFYRGYDPMFTWWVSEPYNKLRGQLKQFVEIILSKLVGVKPGDKDAIIGDPIGREGLLTDLEAEMIPYTPEELIAIGESEYVWCRTEMKKASKDLGYDNWRDALEYVKDLYVPPGEQTQLVLHLANEATEYVKKHDLVTVPRVAEESWRAFMMSPADQKINPFFLGGDDIIVSYPDETMNHEAKMMSMRGNNIHFSRSTVFHEMIPGHHLQFYHIARNRSYRQTFDTPFWMEGWALYWEMILWDKKFPETPENKIGMLFWRMHRCARIIFSIRFHLGLMTPQECIDMLVGMVGHERENAEGEVRRSFNGDYTPLYQAGYMLGALQIYSMRRELVEGGKMSEKQFHDTVLRQNMMPIEMLRALIENKPLTSDFRSSWRFYSGHEQKNV